jgi:enterochelin esterase-like enzyme
MTDRQNEATGPIASMPVSRRALASGLAIGAMMLPQAASAFELRMPRFGRPRTRVQPVAAAGRSGPGQLLTVAAFPSEHAPARRVDIWLPPGYGTRGHRRRMKLLVMHDGQNLFDPATATGNQAWEVDRALSRLIAAGTVPDTVIVGIWNTPERRREYMPERLYAQLPPDIAARIDAGNGGGPLSGGYLAFIVEELLPWVRRTYRVSDEAEDTFVMGSSMGGLISLEAFMAHPKAFGGCAGLSTHWPLLTDEAAYRDGRMEPERVGTAIEAWLSANIPEPRHGGRIYLDHGDQNLDSFYGAYQVRVNAFMEGAGWVPSSGYSPRSFPGGDHNEASWRARLDEPLKWLLGR